MMYCLLGLELVSATDCSIDKAATRIRFSSEITLMKSMLVYSAPSECFKCMLYTIPSESPIFGTITLSQLNSCIMYK